MNCKMDKLIKEKRNFIVKIQQTSQSSLNVAQHKPSFGKFITVVIPDYRSAEPIANLYKIITNNGVDIYKRKPKNKFSPSTIFIDDRNGQCAEGFNKILKQRNIFFTFVDKNLFKKQIVKNVILKKLLGESYYPNLKKYADNAKPEDMVRITKALIDKKA